MDSKICDCNVSDTTFCLDAAIDAFGENGRPAQGDEGAVPP